MKTKVVKFLIIFLFIFIILNINENRAYASEASVSANNCSVGQNFKVTVHIPKDAVGITATLKVTYSDGSSSSKNVYSMGCDINTGKFWCPGDYTTTFSGKVAGNATVALNNIVLSDKNARKLNSNNTATTSVSISGGGSSNGDSSGGSSSSGGSNAPSGGSASANSDNNSQAPANISFSDTSEKMYTSQKVNIRQNYGTDSLVIQTLPVGAEVTRTGVSSGTANRILMEQS